MLFSWTPHPLPIDVPLLFNEKNRGWDAAQRQGRGKYLNYDTVSQGERNIEAYFLSKNYPTPGAF